MPTETLESLKKNDKLYVEDNVDDFIFYVSEWFCDDVAYRHKYTTDDGIYSYFDLEDASCYNDFNDYLSTLNTGVLKCQDKIYWITEYPYSWK
jgi:hypothetical protein